MAAIDGIMFKRGGGTRPFGRKTWKRRYVRADAATKTLRYYESEEAFAADPEHSLKDRVIDLSEASARPAAAEELGAVPAEADPSSAFVFEPAGGGKPLILCAPRSDPLLATKWLRTARKLGCDAPGVAPPPPARQPAPVRPPGEPASPGASAAEEAAAEARLAAEAEEARLAAQAEEARLAAEAEAEAEAEAARLAAEAEAEEATLAAEVTAHAAAEEEEPIDAEEEEAALAAELEEMPAPPEERDDADLEEASAENVRAVFDWVDVNGDEAIQVVEFTNATSGRHRESMRQAGVKLSTMEAYKIPGAVMDHSDFQKLALFQRIDLDGDTMITLEEWTAAFEGTADPVFIAWMSDVLRQLRDLEGGFRPVRRA